MDFGRDSDPEEAAQDNGRPETGQPDPLKLSSIEKNKAITYKYMLERYKEIYYTGDDSAYDFQLK